MIINQFCFVYNIFRNMAPKYYAIAKGRKPGIYNTWEECLPQVNKVPGSIYKKFSSLADAENFIKQYANLNEEHDKKDAVPISCKRSRSQKRRSSDSDNVQPLSKKQKKEIANKNVKAIHEKKRTEPGNFMVDTDGYVNVYTDGACSSNGGKNARAGIGVWFGDAHPLNLSEAVVGRATNNMAEIQAVTTAAKQAKKADIKNLRINTDSRFLISCINNWMPKWKANGWKTINNKPVINKVELLEMEKALNDLNVSWNHVNGHIGIYGNEMADKLARAGCLKYLKKQ